MSESARDRIQDIDDWSVWHDEYENPHSELNMRKRAVQAHVTAIADQHAAPPLVVASICGGQGRELIGALENHKRRADVDGWFIELDKDNAAFAQAWVNRAGLRLKIVNDDASISSTYEGLKRADLIVISGVFGHINASDRKSFVSFLPKMLRDGGAIVWSFLNWDEAQVTQLRRFFQDAGFREDGFEVLDGKYKFTVARSTLTSAPAPFASGFKLFSFGSSRA